MVYNISMYLAKQTLALVLVFIEGAFLGIAFICRTIAGYLHYLEKEIRHL